MATFPKTYPIYQHVLAENQQTHETRKSIYNRLEKQLQRPIVAYLTSFVHRYVMIRDEDTDMLEGILQKMDLSKGLALLINSPGGGPLAAERVINICKNFSGTKEYWTIVAGRAKSAATMICLGSSKIIMGETSELGPIDPQIGVEDEQGLLPQLSVVNIVESYKNLFREAIKAQGVNLEPYLQQLSRYDAREIQEFEQAIKLSKDIAVRYLADGMMKGKTDKEIIDKIKIFLDPKLTLTHGRAIYRDEAKKCGLNIDFADTQSSDWQLIYELYVRANAYISSGRITKLIESKDHSFHVRM